MKRKKCIKDEKTEMKKKKVAIGRKDEKKDKHGDRKD